MWRTAVLCRAALQLCRKVRVFSDLTPSNRSGRGLSVRGSVFAGR